jgi:uncharacterized membrane protein
VWHEIKKWPTISTIADLVAEVKLSTVAYYAT